MSDSQPCVRLPDTTATSETVALAGPSYPRGDNAFGRLRRILGDALALTRDAIGNEAAPEPFGGLYLSPADAQRCLDEANAGPLARVDTARIAPGWNEICEHDPRWEWLRRTYQLCEFELDVVLMALAPEIDRRYERVYGYLQDDLGQKLPTVELALELLSTDLDEKASRRAVFAADAPLIRDRVVALAANPRTSSSSLLAKYLQLDQQVVDVLLGVAGLDRRLGGSCRLSRPSTGLADGDPCGQLAGALLGVVQDAWGARSLTIYFHGAPGTGKRATAESLAAQLGVPLLAVRAGLLGHDDTVDAELAVIFREALLQGALLFIDEFDTFAEGDHRLVQPIVDQQLAARRGVTILAGTSAWIARTRNPLGVMVVPFALPDVARRRALWSAALGEHGVTAAARDIDALASRFRFTASRIHDAVHTAVNEARLRDAVADGASPAARDLFAAARRQSGSELATLARKIEPIYRWDDIVLPADVIAQLRELCMRVAERDRVMGEWGFDRIMSQGKGITALFGGPPGTGKTMAAEVIAGDLGVDLYKIDLSTVVSKYIGETEKNLERIFTVAPQANACLLFDEADAIFGKRSEVRDSHDRYANLEISYLLQRMESYDGLAILTTNRRDYLDEAFTRRLQFIVDFPMPAEAERVRIWQARMPGEAPCDASVDFGYLARAYPLSGANIGNIALRAAYLAAAEDSPITMRHLTSAVLSEYRKIGKVAPNPAGDP